MIPKKKYRDKVRQRLELIKNLFGDRKRVEDMMHKVGGDWNKRGSDFKNKIDAFYMFLYTDAHALLDALDKISENARTKSSSEETKENEETNEDPGSETIS